MEVECCQRNVSGQLVYIMMMNLSRGKHSDLKETVCRNLAVVVDKYMELQEA